uniref:Polyprotein n=1 Tax=Globodera pallida TaxID=36090 RepID=A0A183CU25_GLOPA
SSLILRMWPLLPYLKKSAGRLRWWPPNPQSPLPTNVPPLVQRRAVTNAA